jgi:hypothetical protein
MKVIMDPREARRFAGFLDERGKELREINRRVSLHIRELGMNGWQDHRYQEFLRQFDEASTLLQVFLEHADKYADYLRRKAVPIERYLGRG